MKTNNLLALPVLFILGSCQEGSLPSAAYTQDLNVITKPLYDGADQQAIRVSGGYSTIDIANNEIDLGGGLFNHDYADYDSKINSGIMEISYAKSKKNFSYAAGVFGLYGNYSTTSELPAYTVDYDCYALCLKGNISYDINLDKVNIRLFQFQFGLSQDFGDYSDYRNRREDLQGTDTLYFDLIHPPNAILMSYSLSTIFNFKINDFGVRTGVNFSFVDCPNLSDESYVFNMILGWNYKKLDFYFNYYLPLDGPFTLFDNSLQVGLGYQIPVGKK